jgi:hypothetical protein
MNPINTLNQIIDDLQINWANDPDVSLNEFHWRWQMIEQSRVQLIRSMELLCDLIDLDGENDEND